MAPPSPADSAAGGKPFRAGVHGGLEEGVELRESLADMDGLSAADGANGDGLSGTQRCVESEPHQSSGTSERHLRSHGGLHGDAHHGDHGHSHRHAHHHDRSAEVLRQLENLRAEVQDGFGSLQAELARLPRQVKPSSEAKTKKSFTHRQGSMMSIKSRGSNGARYAAALGGSPGQSYALDTSSSTRWEADDEEPEDRPRKRIPTWKDNILTTLRLQAPPERQESYSSEASEASQEGGDMMKGVDADKHEQAAGRALDRALGKSFDCRDQGPTVSTMRRLARRVVMDTWWFDGFMGVIIILNSVTIGIEIQLALDNNSSPFLQRLEHAFLAIFLAELMLRMQAHGSGCCSNPWIMFDSVLVFVGVLSSWIVEPILESGDSSWVGEAGFIDVVSQVLIIRFLRLLRIVRTLRLLHVFQELWSLCRGLMQAFRTVLSACVLIILVVYILGCVAVEVITLSSALRQNPVTNEIIEERFSSLPTSMLTFFQFANADSIAGIYVPLIEVHPLLSVFFAIVWLLLTLLIMNLVTAVIVNSAIDMAAEDAEMRQTALRRHLKKLQPAMMKMFHCLDVDKDGVVKMDDFDLIDFSTLRVPRDLRGFLKADQLKDLFDFFDIDHSGVINKDEFVEGVCHLAIADDAHATQQMHMLRLIMKRLSFVENTLTMISDRWDDSSSTCSADSGNGGMQSEEM